MHVQPSDALPKIMLARYYGANLGRFLSVDPGDDTSLHLPQSWNHYSYVRNNPILYNDPKGTCVWDACVGEAIIVGGAAAVAASVWLASPNPNGGTNADAIVEAGADLAKDIGDSVSDTAGAVGGFLSSAWQGITSVFNESEASDGNTNPYAGPVDTPVTVVDEAGNAIPVGQGEQITASPDGTWQQVRDSDGNPTGTRLDGPHKESTHPDNPEAQQAHAHRPGVTNESGNPQLPTKKKSE